MAVDGSRVAAHPPSKDMRNSKRVEDVPIPQERTMV
jgi:hypothetical protein